MLSSPTALQRTGRIKCPHGGRKSVTLSFPERRANEDDWLTSSPWTFLNKTPCRPIRIPHMTGDHKILFSTVPQIQKCHPCDLKTHWPTLAPEPFTWCPELTNEWRRLHQEMRVCWTKPSYLQSHRSWPSATQASQAMNLCANILTNGLNG